MLNSHSRVAIAQIVFYTPLVPLAVFMLYRNVSKKSRMAWIPLLPYCLIRFVGGIVTILLNNNQGSVGLIITTLILLGIGIIPLIISMLGFVRIILASSFPDRHLAHRIVVAVRILFTIAAILLVIGSALDGNYTDSSSVSIGQKLVQAGYLVFASILGILIIFHIYLWQRTARLTETDIIILKATSLAIPFLIVRTAYALLSVFATSLNSKWTTINGSAIAFALMALLMEYIVVSIYFYIGFSIPSNRQRNNQQCKNANPCTRDQEHGTLEIDTSQLK